jgi:hypothetical protein
MIEHLRLLLQGLRSVFMMCEIALSLSPPQLHVQILSRIRSLHSSGSFAAVFFALAYYFTFINRFAVPGIFLLIICYIQEFVCVIYDFSLYFCVPHISLQGTKVLRFESVMYSFAESSSISVRVADAELFLTSFSPFHRAPKALLKEQSL